MSGHSERILDESSLSELRWDDLTGPGRIPCEQGCEVPAGVTLIPYPETRHAWPGILHCPNGCGRCFEVQAND